jgi:hypothetical protein
VSVHRLLIGILRDALVAPTDRAGFGLAAAAIPPQGTTLDPDYLDTLIIASGVSRKELRNRLRVSFDRPSGETSSGVALNIEAVQGLMTESAVPSPAYRTRSRSTRRGRKTPPRGPSAN